MIKNKAHFLIILSAPSGGGKSTILNEILRKLDDIDYSVSYTTRTPRGEEQNGIHYHFVTEDEFQTRISAGDFLEHACVFGRWYGTSISYIKSRLNAGRHVIMDIDVQGAAQISDTDIPYVKIFILPPTMQVLRDRLIKRNTDTMEEIDKRLMIASQEITQICRYDYLVINDDLDQAVDEVACIISAEANRVVRYCAPDIHFLHNGEDNDKQQN